MLKAGVIDGPIARVLEKAIRDSVDDEIVDAEVIEDSDEMPALEVSNERIPPPWVEDEDQEYIPGSWIPDDAESGEDYSH